MKPIDSDPTTTDDSGVFARSPMRRALDLATRWHALEPRATDEPRAVRALHERVAAVQRECMNRLTALECSTGRDPDARETDELLDASYVLERLEWCVLHHVPYVERPGASSARWIREA